MKAVMCLLMESNKNNSEESKDMCGEKSVKYKIDINTVCKNV